MKIVLLNDLHFGTRNDHPVLLDHLIEFLSNTVIPYCVENGIKDIYHLGDFFDRRKYVNIKTLYRLRTEFLEPLFEAGVRLNLLLGNHDVYFRNTNHINSPREILSTYNENQVRIFESPVEIGDKLCIIPWVNDSNYTESMSLIKTSDCPYLLGHFDIIGFEVFRGIESDEGFNPDIFSKYRHVLTGHYHIKSEKENIKYLGSQYQMTFSDVGETKGFHTLDMDTGDLDFIENPKSLFHTIVYSDDSESLMNHLQQIKGCFVKVLVVKKENLKMFEDLISGIHKQDPVQVTIIDMLPVSVETEESGTNVNMSKSTLEILLDESEKSASIEQRDGIKKLISELYTEALSENEYIRG